MFSKHHHLVPFTFLALGFLAGCRKEPVEVPRGEENRPANPFHAKLALNWLPEPEFGGFYAARETAAYKDEGIDIEIQGGGAGVPVLQMVDTGRADFGTVTGDELVMARARGADVVAVFATFQTSPQGIMVHASRGLKKIEDAFQSGTLAFETGVPCARFLKENFKWGPVKIVPYDGGIARFLLDPKFGQQCYITSEPIAAKQKGADPQVFMIADTGFNPYATVVFTRRALLQQSGPVVRAFVRATARGWRAYLAHPETTNGLLGKLNSSMDAATLTAAAQAQRPLIETAFTKEHGLGAMEGQRWSRLVSQLLAMKLINQQLAIDDIFIAPETAPR